jgi:hypothetical protein
MFPFEELCELAGSQRFAPKYLKRMERNIGARDEVASVRSDGLDARPSGDYRSNMTLMSFQKSQCRFSSSALCRR